MSGELGICLQGYHPDLKEETCYDTNLGKTIHDIRHKAQTYFARIGDHPDFTRQVISIESSNQSNDGFHCCSHAIKSKNDRETDSEVVNFIRGEELGTLKRHLDVVVAVVTNALPQDIPIPSGRNKG